MNIGRIVGESGRCYKVARHIEGVHGTIDDVIFIEKHLVVRRGKYLRELGGI